MALANTLARAVVRRPLPIIAVLGVLTIALGWFAQYGLSFRVVLEEMLPVGRENVQLMHRFGAQFGGANTTLIAVERVDGTIYDEEFLARYKDIADRVHYHPDTIRHLVQSLVLRKTKAISGSGGRIDIEGLMWPDLPRGTAALDTLRRNVRAQYLGLLVSDDERSAMVIADFKDETDYPALVDFIDELRAEHEGAGLRIYASGRPILLGTIYRALPEIAGIFAVSVLLLSLMLLAYFRHWLGVAVPLVTASVAMVWGFGAMGAVRYNLDPLLILLPAFIFAIVLSHSVQFVSRVLEEFGEHHHMRAAVEHGLAKLMFPSLGAIVTDAAGFTVLALIGIPSMQTLGLICTVWLLSVVPSLVLSAALLAMFPRPKRYRFGMHMVERIWSGLNLARHARVTVAASILVLIGASSIAMHLTIGEATGSPILWPDSRYNQDTDAINARFSRVGTDLMLVYVEGPDKTMVDPAVYHRIEALDRHVYTHVEAARPAQSLAPVIKKINEVLYEGDPSYALVPDTPEEAGFNIYMFSSRGEPGDFAAFTDRDWRIGNVIIPVRDHAAETVDSVIATARDFLDSAPALENGARFLTAGGQVGITKDVNDEIRASNRAVTLAIVAVIAFCVLLLYRSLAVSLIVVTTLVTANVVTYAVMVWQDIGLSINVVPLAGIGMGLGVDYAIYVIGRMREETQAGAELFEAVLQTVRTSGNAVVITALSVIIPLLPWFFLSSIRFQAEMGLLLAMVLFMNVLGALVFIPAAMLVFRPRALAARSPAAPPAGFAAPVAPVPDVPDVPLTEEAREVAN